MPVFGPGGQFDGRFQTPDEYTGYHRFGYDPLTRRTTPNVNELTHKGLQVDLDWDSTDTCTSSRRLRTAISTTRSAAIPTARRFPQLYTWDTSKHEQFTQEFQLSGLIGAERRRRVDDGPLLLRRVRLESGLRQHVHVYTSNFSDHKDEQDLKNYAVFAHFDWAITDKLSMSGGLRYTDDEKDATIYRVTGNTAPPGVGSPQFVLIDIGVVTVESQEWSPKLSFDYQFTDTMMGYVQLATGFRGGGFSPRPANALQLTAFHPEFIDSFEVGVKTDWLDRRLRFNGDVYYMENTDKQQPIADCAPCTPTRVNSFPTVNTGESRNWGVEAEILAEPVESLRIDFSLGYQNYKVTDLGTAAGLFITVPDTTRRSVDPRRRHVLAAHAGVELRSRHAVRVPRRRPRRDAHAALRLHVAGRHLVRDEPRGRHRQRAGRPPARLRRGERAGHLDAPNAAGPLRLTP